MAVKIRLTRKAQEMENILIFLEHTTHSQTQLKSRLTMQKLKNGWKMVQHQLKQQNPSWLNLAFLRINKWRIVAFTASNFVAVI